FRIDYSSPISMVGSLSTTATTYLSAPLTSVTGTADDLAGGSGISSVFLRVRRSDGNYLNAAENGFDNLSSNFPIPTSNGTTWSKNPFLDPLHTFQDGYRYDLETQATDNSSPANVQQVFTTASILVDESTPTSGFSNILG